MARDRERLVVVSTHYYLAYLARSVAFAEHAARRLGAAECILVAGDPSLQEALDRSIGRFACPTRVCGHDNRGLEFGAYQRGLDAASERGELAWVAIVNDTCSVHQPFAGERLDNVALQVGARADDAVPTVIGQVEGLSRSFLLLGARTHRWITSNLMALNRSALQALGRRLYCAELDALIRPAERVDEFFAPELDAVLREHVGRWLFDPHAEFHWYRAAPLDAGNAERFAGKARSILQEMYLAARLESQSAAFVDVKYLRRWQRLAQRFLERPTLEPSVRRLRLRAGSRPFW